MTCHTEPVTRAGEVGSGERSAAMWGFARQGSDLRLQTPPPPVTGATRAHHENHLSRLPICGSCQRGCPEIQAPRGEGAVVPMNLRRGQECVTATSPARKAHSQRCGTFCRQMCLPGPGTPSQYEDPGRATPSQQCDPPSTRTPVRPLPPFPQEDLDSEGLLAGMRHDSRAVGCRVATVTTSGPSSARSTRVCARWCVSFGGFPPPRHWVTVVSPR